MLALRKTSAAEGPRLEQVAEPTPAGGEALVAVEAAGICGTDLHIADGSPGYESMASALPVTLGHEFAGRVVAGRAALLSRVVVRPSVICGVCEDCAKGSEDHCRRRRGIGIHRQGGFAALAVVPARNCVALPDALDAELAALVEPMTVAAHAVAQAGIGAGSDVLVLGPGPIGLGAAIFAAEAGAEVSVRGRDDAPRLALARGLGFEAGGEETRFDAVIEAAGSPEAAADGLRHLRPGGRLVIAGIHARPASIDLTALVRAEHAIIGSYRAPVAAWPRTIAAIAARPERFRALITHRLPLAAALEGFEAMRSRAACKVMLTP